MRIGVLLLFLEGTSALLRPAFGCLVVQLLSGKFCLPEVCSSFASVWTLTGPFAVGQMPDDGIVSRSTIINETPPLEVM